jgi:peptide methionine sulfoxide reductase msrA/msrB
MRINIMTIMSAKLKFLGLMLLLSGHLLKGSEPMHYNVLTPEEELVILCKGTEQAFTGQFYNHHEDGNYTCKRCNAMLYRSADKFDAGCGWPSFDDEIPGAIKRVPDTDGMRTEIQCADCGAHLGHVFEGEGFTPKNIRHCVNSISLNFIPGAMSNNSDSFGPTDQPKDENSVPAPETAIFAAGCFWGIEHYFKQEPGVVSTMVGYTGGDTPNPSYQEVCSGTTGYQEAIEVRYDSHQTSYEALTKLFFEIHDFTQTNGQGPDLGEQYLSYIYYLNEDQKAIALNLIEKLRDKGFKVATRLEKAAVFYPAEEYHQDYYAKTGKQPYCHFRRKIFD